MSNRECNRPPAKAFTNLVVLACLTGLFHPAGVSARSGDEPSPESGIKWLEKNFTGAFTWTFVDPGSGEEITGKGDCRMVLGGRFLECTHFAPGGETMGIGISGFHPEKQRFQWMFYGAESSAMLFGEGKWDPETESSVIEGKQQLPGMPEFTFRTVTKRISEGVWSYAHYRLDGEAQVEMFRATFSYGR